MTGRQSWLETSRRHARLAVLRILNGAPGRRANASVLRAGLDALLHRLGREALEGELAWLADQGLVTLERVDGMTLATLTSRGADVADDLAQVPGVARPDV